MKNTFTIEHYFIKEREPFELHLSARILLSEFDSNAQMMHLWVLQPVEHRYLNTVNEDSNAWRDGFIS